MRAGTVAAPAPDAPAGAVTARRPAPFDGRTQAVMAPLAHPVATSKRHFLAPHPIPPPQGGRGKAPRDTPAQVGKTRRRGARACWPAGERAGDRARKSPPPRWGRVGWGCALVPASGAARVRLATADTRASGASSPKDTGNFRDHAIAVGQHLVVPEPQHAKAVVFEPAGAIGIPAGALGVLAAVHLDHHAPGEAREIDDESAERPLAAKPATGDLAAPKPRPQATLGIGRVVAELAGTGDRHGIIVPPTPSLPRKGGGGRFGPGARTRGEGEDSGQAPARGRRGKIRVRRPHAGGTITAECPHAESEGRSGRAVGKARPLDGGGLGWG